MLLKPVHHKKKRVVHRKKKTTTTTHRVRKHPVARKRTHKIKCLPVGSIVIRNGKKYKIVRRRGLDGKMHRRYLRYKGTKAVTKKGPVGMKKYRFARRHVKGGKVRRVRYCRT